MSCLPVGLDGRTIAAGMGFGRVRFVRLGEGAGITSYKLQFAEKHKKGALGLGCAGMKVALGI
jgi:hypothetical protein